MIYKQAHTHIYIYTYTYTSYTYRNAQIRVIDRVCNRKCLETMIIWLRVLSKPGYFSSFRYWTLEILRLKWA